MPETVFKGSRLAKTRSDVGVAARRKDPVALEDARRNFAAEKIAAYITKELDKAPPLTDQQRTKLAELLKPARDVITQTRLAELGGDTDAA